jgi:hypothetical protein
VDVTTHEQRTSYDGIEHRCFEMDDFWLGPCQLLGAMVADDCIAQLWERGDFDALEVDELEDAHRRVFRKEQRRTVAVAHRLVWDVTLEYHAKARPQSA